MIFSQSSFLASSNESTKLNLLFLFSKKKKKIGSNEINARVTCKIKDLLGFASDALSWHHDNEIFKKKKKKKEKAFRDCNFV